MLPDFKKIIEVFECMSLDNNAYFTFQNQDNITVCIQYEKKTTQKDWSIWFSSHAENSKQVVSSQHLFSAVNAFKINENDFINEIANILLLQAAFADEFIRQISDLLGKVAVQKSILTTQNFMDELSQSLENIFKTEDELEANPKSDRKGLRVIK